MITTAVVFLLLADGSSCFNRRLTGSFAEAKTIRVEVDTRQELEDLCGLV